jgi:DNA-binding response OmpR family regulator
MKILIVEDDEKIANFLLKGLKEESYTVDHTIDGYEAVYLAQVNSYDLIILDVLLPSIDGFEVCKVIRQRLIETPIIMLTARDSITDKVTGLDFGADDYLTKPFSFEELLARIKVQLRKKSTTTNIIKIEDLQIDTNQRQVIRDDKRISLTAKEYSLLEFLARNKEKVLSETLINENLSDMDSTSMSNIINVYIYRLRNKIDKGFDKKLIHTVRGAGYMLGVNSYD